MPPPPGEARRTVRTFAWASFLHDLGADMVFSVWPLFLRNVLGASMTAVGVIDGIGEALVSLSQAASGYLSDRLRKRKVFVWLGYALGGVARVGYALAPTWHVILPFRILDRAGKLRGSPRDAMISELSHHADRGGNFGLQRMMDNLGAVCGVSLSLLLLPLLGYRPVFLLAAVPSLLAALLILRRIRENVPTGPAPSRGLRLRDIDRNLRLYLAANALLQLGSFSYSFLLIAAADRGVAAGAVPVLYLLYTFVAALASLPAGRLADRIGRKPVLALSLLSWALVAALFLVTRHPAGALAAFVLYGLHLGMLDPVQKTLAAELSPKRFVASTLGGFQLVLGAMALPASLLAGFLWDSVSPAAPFVLSLALTALSLLLLLFVRERR
ncbi:MAG: MFS transporter [Candidatus Peribacteraceae bacterium]|nr:MFS transporter [Candidatus Peribacteraceae bacterium]